MTRAIRVRRLDLFIFYARRRGLSLASQHIGVERIC